jgi:hypothetical protein
MESAVPRCKECGIVPAVGASRCRGCGAKLVVPDGAPELGEDERKPMPKLAVPNAPAAAPPKPDGEE